MDIKPFFIGILAIMLIIGLGGCATKAVDLQNTSKQPDSGSQNVPSTDSGTPPSGNSPVLDTNKPLETLPNGKGMGTAGEGEITQGQPVPGSGAADTVVAKEYIVEITDTGYIPQKVSIRQGDAVKWINKGTKDNWPASAKHPTHTVYAGGKYDEPGTYLGSQACKSEGQPKTGAFDPCKPLKTGESFTFTFDENGTWAYHEHIAVKMFGQIIVGETEPGQPPAIPQLPQAQTEQAKEFSIIARNWSFEPSEIIVNKGDKVKLTIKSIDVTHGFMLPAFNVSKSLEPGKEIVAEFTTNQAGEFPFFCNVFCGFGHSEMKGKLIVK